MSKTPFASNRCTISDDWKYKDMPVIFMENDFIRVGILAGRGSDIFEFSSRKHGVDFMCRLPKEIHNPNQHFSQLRDTGNQLEDYYYGGWQETLPNSEPFVYRGASLGQHGEISLVPWKHSIIENTPERVSLKLSVRPLRLPLYLEKTLTLKNDSPVLHIEEKLVNESKTTIDFMWGHHIAFGLPFLQEGAELITNATEFVAEKAMPDTRVFDASQPYKWPNVKDKQGNEVQANQIPSVNAEPFCELAYLSGFPDLASYTLWHESQKLGFKVQWDSSVFSHLWFWQEHFATQDAPWWGSAHAVGLEPWTAPYTANPEEAIKNGDWMKLDGGEIIHSKLEASVVETKPE